MRAIINYTLRHWPAFALVTSAAMLAIAHGFQTFGHLAPCDLCLRQREVYWVVLPITALALPCNRTGPFKGFAPWLGAIMALVFLAGAGIATYHAGAEWKFWPGPQACSGAGGHATAAAISRLLAGAKVEAPHCDVAAWRFLGISMAGWNAVISLKLAGWSAAWALWSRK